MTQNFYFDIQRFATGTAVKIGGVVNNVEVGDTFTVEGAKYTVLAVEKNSVTALVDGTPAENLGKQIVIGDGKSIDGVTYQTTALEDTDSDISTKYTYKLDIGGNAVFVMVFDNAIESVEDSGGNSLSATGGKYSVGGKDFSLTLDDGIPVAEYTATNSVATVLDKVTYSFSVDSKPVEVVVKNDAISSVTVDSKQVGTKAGTYSVGEKSLKVSYAGGNLTAETAAPVSTSIISSVATYQVGDTKVTVTDGKLSTSTAKVNGHNATLSYSADTKKITASYTVTTSSTTTTGDPNTYIVTLPDNSTVKVTVNGNSISSVTYKNQTITAENSTYTVTNGTTKYNLKFDYANNALTATALATTTISASESAEVYTVTVKSGDTALTNTIKVTTKDSTVNLYQGDSTDALTATNDVYTVTVGNTPVKLTYDTTDGLGLHEAYVIDLSKLTKAYTARNGDILTGKLSGNYKISIAAGATVTLRGATIDQTDNGGKAGIECAGTATIVLVGTNTVKGAHNGVNGSCAGIQAGGENTTLTIKGSGSLEATGGHSSAGIGASNGGTCGDIVIESGTITATSRVCGAGIGAGSAKNSNNSSKCGNITINGGTVTATSKKYGAGIGTGDADDINHSSKCGNITITGGTVTATGNEGGAGIGTGEAKNGDGTAAGNVINTCGNITIASTVTKVTAKGSWGSANIGAGVNNATTDVQVGTIKVPKVDDGVTINGDLNENNDTGYTITGTGTDSSGDDTGGGTTSDETVTITLTSAEQTFKVDNTTVTFTTDSAGKTTYKIGEEEGDGTSISNGGTITVGDKTVKVTISNDGVVTSLEYDETETLTPKQDQKTVTTSSTQRITTTFDATLTIYTFAVDGKNVSVAVDSSGKMTYDGNEVTNNKITVDGVEVTLNVSGKEITGASYLGEYSPVTNIEQVDAYKATIDEQEVSLIFDANNQCTVEVNGKNYLLTKTASGATFTSEVEKTGVEDSRIYLLEVGGEKYWIGCTFDAKGNLTAVTSDDKNLSIDGTTIKIGDYTVEVSGTKDELKTSATLTVYGEGVKDVEVNQLFVLSGVKSTDGITVKNNVVTLTAANLNGQDVTIEGDGYTLALDKNYSPTTATTEHFDGNIYKSESFSDGYEISSDAKLISYVEETPATNLFTLSGVKSTDGITVKNNVVTLTAKNLNNQDVTIEGDGYTLALDKNYSPTTTGEHFDGNTYKSASNTDGYEISDDAKSISYVSEIPATNLFTLSGVKSTDGITVRNNVVTLTAANLNNQDATILGDGYTLALANGIKPPTFDEGGWTLSGTTATYTSESNTDGYTLAGDKKVVTYTPAHDADISLKVYGVKSLDGLSLSGTTVTVAASSLDKQTVTISKGYTLAIADDVEQPSTRGKYWTQLDEDTYLYTSSSTTAGYTLSKNKITYSDESVSGEQYTIKGAAGTELISETDDTEDVAEDSLSRRKVVLIETDEHNPENKLDFYTENYAQVKIASGQDSLITYDGARSKVDMADADNVTVVSFDGQVQLDNYDVESGAVVLVQDINDIIDAIKTNKIKLVGNEIRINFSSRVAINNPNNDSTVVELVNYDDEKQLVGFTGKNGGTLDMSEFDENAVLKGNYSENSPETKYIGSMLKGGAGDDMLLAGSRDYADGGEGRNEIYLTPYELRYKKDGATIVSGGNSRNNVYNFHEGFGYDGDYVQVENLSDVEFKFENDGLSIASKNARLKLKGIGVNSSSADAVSDFGAENPELILLTDGQTTLNSAIAKTDESILVTEKDGLKPNAFFGKRSGLNFSEYGGTVEVNLSDGTGALGDREAIFKGINKIQAGDGISRLIGSDESNTLIAGNGYGSLAGGAGDDELFGRSGSADKAGRTEFLYFEGDGRDVIYDFEFLTAENKNSGTADKIGVDTLVTKISCSGNDVVLQMNNSDENLTIKDAAGKTFQINDLAVKVDKNIVYDGLANLYIADGGDLVSVDSGVESAEIWLDNSRKTAFVGEIKTLDASAVDGKTSLAGNAFDNTIIAGNGDSSLWGGDFGNDLLIGGGGKNTFFYNFGNGNDTIQNAKAGDVVDLTNITLAEISAANITDSGVELEFSDGGTLTVSGTNCEYRVAGTSYVVDNGKWKIK
ncbi:MAG: hypothetical protein IKE46_02130 [Selenomonadaceae bacterium]|nr:hypothetical protein [Selenomonadaceae bacterium]